MFLKQEKPEMDDFERKKNLGSIKCLTDSFSNKYIYLHILLFQTILSIFFYLRKKLAFFSGEGSTPPPLADTSAKNASFLTGSLSYCRNDLLCPLSIHPLPS